MSIVLHLVFRLLTPNPAEIMRNFPKEICAKFLGYSRIKVVIELALGFEKKISEFCRILKNNNAYFSTTTDFLIDIPNL